MLFLLYTIHYVCTLHLSVWSHVYDYVCKYACKYYLPSAYYGCLLAYRMLIVMCDTLNVQIIFSQNLWTFVDSFTRAIEYTACNTTQKTDTS